MHKLSRINESELISWLAVVRSRNLLGVFSLHGNKQLVHIKIHRLY